MVKAISLLGVLVMMVAMVGLYTIGSLVSFHPLTIGLQVIAVALVVWARVIFGRGSLHAGADPTVGGLVTTGPYRYIRNPIYTAGCLFGWGGIVTHSSWLSVTLGLLLLAGALIRVLCEERLLKRAYPEYLQYAERTKRMVPYVF